MKSGDFPFKECELCKTLGDCPCPDVAQDLMGSPMPPPNCPKEIEVMKQTYKKRKKYERNTT